MNRTMDNVARLRPVWSFATGVNGGHDWPPIINDGVMYVTAPGNYLYDLDARIGDFYWAYEPPIAGGGAVDGERHAL